jgi:type II secretory pathway pseudopilin PulG
MRIDPTASRSRRVRLVAGFTLPELMIAMTIFIFLVIGIVSANIFGLRLFQVAQNRLGSSDDARAAVERMIDDIRTCNSTLVGSVTNGVFTGVVNGEAQSGGALMVYPSTNTTSYVLYFANPADQTFRRTSTASGMTMILAQSITNLVLFTAQDCMGNVLTNSQNNRVIHLCLEFYQPRGTCPTADSYKIETSVTRRAL